MSRWALLALLPLLACANEAEPAAAETADELEACTSTFGSDLGGTWQGRLDGDLVAIVPSGTHGCHGDRSHLHLQIRMDGQVYDVAVNVDDVKLAELDAPLLGAAFSEGWHPSTPLDYVSDLEIHSGSFRSSSQPALERTLTTALASADHVSIFATKYSRSGVHLVHRSRSGRPYDGAIVLRPTTATPHYLLFSFPDQRF
jgi:hypothetical protein